MDLPNYSIATVAFVSCMYYFDRAEPVPCGPGRTGLMNVQGGFHDANARGDDCRVVSVYRQPVQ